MSLSQLVTLAISPLGTAFLLLLLALLLVALRRRRAAAVFALVATVWLYAWSTPVLSHALRAGVESRYPFVPAGRLPAADAIVVLGGAVAPPTSQGGKIELNRGADRVWFAAEVYRAGKAPLLLLSGGSDPKVFVYSEAQAMRVVLRIVGVPDAAMLLEERSRTTHQNAVYSTELLRARGLRHVLLVTSALHMPRAVAEFQGRGLEVTPAPTDFEAVQAPAGLRKWLPDADALGGSARAMKEVLGSWVIQGAD